MTASRPAPRHRSLRAGLLGTLLGLTVALGAWALHDDFGVTYDEGAQAHYGELALAYYASGGADDRVLRFYNLRHYGPAVEMAAAGAARLRDTEPWATRHLVVGLASLLALPAVTLFAALLGRPWLAVLAPVLLLVQPRWVGHVFNNSKDAPFAAGVALFMAALAWLLLGRGQRVGRTAAAGLALGFALAVRPGGVVLLGVLAAAAVAVRSWRGGPVDGGRAGIPLRELAGAAALGAGVLWVLWPTAHAAPLAALREAVETALAFPRPIPVLFDGRITASTLLPAWYVPEFLRITTPPTLLLLVAAGTLRTGGRLVRGERGREAAAGAVLLAWLFLPLLLVLLRPPAVYDGVRHFLFLLPALAILAAVGAGALFDLARPRTGRARALAGVGVAALVLPPVHALVSLHPYQSTYFNAFVGGVAGADGRYETDYWLAGYGEAIAWINRAEAGRDPVRVLVSGQPVPTVEDLADGPECWTERRVPLDVDVARRFARDAAAHRAADGVRVAILPELWAEGADPASVDYYVSTTRFGYDRCFPDAPVVHRVGRSGATFVVVKDLSRGRRAPPGPEATAGG